MSSKKTQKEIHGLLTRPRDELTRSTGKSFIMLMAGSRPTGEIKPDGKKVYKAHPEEPPKMRIYQGKTFMEIDIIDIANIVDLWKMNEGDMSTGLFLALNSGSKEEEERQKLLKSLSGE